MGQFNRIDRTSLIPKNGPGAAGFVIRKVDNQIVIDRGAQVGHETIATTAVGFVTADTTLTSGDSGLQVFANSSTFINVTLPKQGDGEGEAQAGTRFRILTATVPSATGTKITPNAADKFQGHASTDYSAKTAGQTLTNTQATAKKGDFIEVVADGAGVWYVVGQGGTWA